MTLEEILNDLETALAALRRDMQPHKFKVGDAVLLSGKVVEVDQSELPYKVNFGGVGDSDIQWFAESSLRAAT